MPKKIPPPSLSDKGKTISFHRFPSHIWHDQNLSLHERVVLCRVWSFENSTPALPCYLSFEQWARELGCTRRHAINLLTRLVDRSFLKKESRGLDTNIWRLVNTVHYQQWDSEYSSPLIVNTVHYPSEYSSPLIVNTVHPRRSLEDQLEDHKEDQTVADAPTPLSEFSLILEEPQDSDPLKESDSPEKLTEVSEAPPIPPAPPKAKKTKQIEGGWSDVQAAATPEQWESIEMWRKHRTQMKKPCTPLSIMQNIKKYGANLSAAIEHSIEKGWQGIFPPSPVGIEQKNSLTAGLTDKEIDLRLDFMWAYLKQSPIVPPIPFKDLVEEDLVVNVLRSIFGEDYEEKIRKRGTDEKLFYRSDFRNKYKQGVESTKL